MLIRTTLAWMLLFSTVIAAQKVVVVVDDSGSMADRMRHERVRKIEAAKRSLSVVLEKLPADAELGLLALNRGWMIPLQKLNRNQVKQQVEQLRARGGTPLGSRMKEATDELLKLRDKDPYGDYRLLIVTDGEASDQNLLNAVLPDIMSRNLLVDVIGVDMQSEHSLATQVSNYRRADDPDTLEEAIAQSLAESDDSQVVGGQSDFELLSILPIDITPIVISALTSTNNAPIAETGSDVDGGDTVFLPNSGQGGGGGGFGVSGILCMVVLFFAVAIVSSLFKQFSRPSRNRRW